MGQTLHDASLRNTQSVKSSHRRWVKGKDSKEIKDFKEINEGAFINLFKFFKIFKLFISWRPFSPFLPFPPLTPFSILYHPCQRKTTSKRLGGGSLFVAVADLTY